MLALENLVEDLEIATATLKPLDLKAPLRECGYRRDLLRFDVGVTSTVTAPLVGFAHLPADTRSACVAVLEATENPRRVVEQVRPLGTPLVFVCFENTLQLWKQGAESAEWLQSIEQKDVPNFVRSQQDKFSPSAIYRAKTWGRFKTQYQLEFVDLGLMPLLEEEIGTALGRLIERNVSDLKSRLAWKDVSGQQGHWLIQTVFWLVSGKILRDKSVDAFNGISLVDVETLFDKVAKHYGSKKIDLASKKNIAALEESARSIEQFASLELTTTEALAHVYENTLISKETRSSLGTHSTPSYLVDYVVGNLAEWIREIPENERSVFEPACGHAAFLTSAMRLLSELLPDEKSVPSRRGPYLRTRLHGTDIDAFALELARLSLTLADIPNPDGWDLRIGDMFIGDSLASQAAKCTVLLANPPFENFSPGKRKEYQERGSEIRHFNKAAEMLSRTLPNLPNGGVFGLVLPQAFLHSANSSKVREFLLKQCELQEVCLLPDKVFPESDAETAVLMGRRVSPKNNSIRFRRVRERDYDNFRVYYETTTSEQVTQSKLENRENFSLRVSDLSAVWQLLSGNPSLSDVARLGQGFVFHGTDLPSGSITYSERRFPEAVRGFVQFGRGLMLHSQPKLHWVNLHSSVIRRPQSGTETGTAQVLLNYAPAHRGAWRLKALLDRSGHAVTSRFIPVRPTSKHYSIEVLWALLNSPVANAYAFSHLGKRDNLVGDIRRIPVPNSTSFEELTVAAKSYLKAASSQVETNVLRHLLNVVDCAVLRLYKLPPELERSLLDLFADYKRVGVPFTQVRFYPDEFKHPIRFEEYLELEANWPNTNRERGKLIDKEIEGKITESESVRLAALQAYADFYLQKTTPRSVKALEELEDHIFRRSANKDGMH